MRRYQSKICLILRLVIKGSQIPMIMMNKMFKTQKVREKKIRIDKPGWSWKKKIMQAILVVNLNM